MLNNDPIGTVSSTGLKPKHKTASFLHACHSSNTETWIADYAFLKGIMLG